jgi:PKD repeat protein
MNPKKGGRNMRKTKRWIAMFAMLALGLGVFLSGCSDDDEDVVPTPAEPVADFSADNTSGLTVQFTDSSTGSIDTYSWDFGDNTTSTEQNPSHTYDNAATYTVALTVTGPGGSDTATKDVTVTVAPPQLQAFEFPDQNNALAGAAIGAGVTNFISGLGGVTVDILFNLAVPDGFPLSVRPMVDVPVDICESGTAIAVWDNTAVGVISAGDNVTVTFDNCVITIAAGTTLNGTVSLSFDNASLSEFPIGTADVSTTVNLEVDEPGVDTTVFTGSFHMTYASETGEIFDFVIGDGGVTELLTFSDGVDTIRFGCFDAPLTFNPDNVLLSPRGVVNWNNIYIMQLGDYGVPVDNNPLVFGYVGSNVAPGPYAGQLKQLSFDDRPNQDPALPACSAVGSTVHEGNTSLLVTATSGDPGGVTYPVTIDWFANTTWTDPPAGTDNTAFWDDL